MIKSFHLSTGVLSVAIGMSVIPRSNLIAETEFHGAPYRVVAMTQIPAAGWIDYVTADSANRRLYVACGNGVNIFDLDSFKLTGTLLNASGHGVAVDSDNHTGLVSGDPAVLFDTRTLDRIKTIPAPGADGYIFDPFTHHFIILSHRNPNLLVLDSKDGSIVGAVAAIGPNGINAAVEQGAADGEGHLYFDVANQHHIAVVDSLTLKVTGHFDLGEEGVGPAGLTIDTKNHILFAMCRGGQGGKPVCVILSAIDGKVLARLPLAGRSDGAAFNSQTMEAFSSHGNGTLSVIKENSPTEFSIEGTVQTKSGGKTCSLDTKTGRIIVITREAASAPTPAAKAPTPSSDSLVAATPASKGNFSQHSDAGPQLLDVIFIGR